MQKRPISFKSLIPFLAGAANCALVSVASAGPIVNDFSSPAIATSYVPAGYLARDVFYSRHAEELEKQTASISADEVGALLVLFLPWTEAKPVPPPPGTDGNGGNGSTTPPNEGSGNDGNGNNGGNGGNGPGPGDPGGDPGGGGGHTVHDSPEPTTMLSGMLGAGMAALIGWRRRRRTNP